MRYSFTAHFRPSLFQEAVGEGWAINRIGASHGDCPLPGRVTVSLPGTELYRIMASPGTLTLFLKLTTKAVHLTMPTPRVNRQTPPLSRDEARQTPCSCDFVRRIAMPCYRTFTSSIT